MNRTFFIGLAIAVAACSDDSGPICFCDAGPQPDVGVESGCNPVAQTGCEAGQKCTWQDVTDATGRIACVPAGTIPISGTCTFLAPGETSGYDDCVAGAYCISNACQEICTDAPDSCDTTVAACSVYSGIFVDTDVTVGVCDFKCEPGTQERLFDGAAACGGTTERPRGCYGWAWGVSPIDFVCMRDISDAQHGDTPDPLSPQPLLNACDAGYFLWVASFEDTAPDVCIAFCMPGETHSGNTANVDGVAPGTCGNKGAAGDDMECRYLHIFDVTPPRDQYNASGVCLGTALYVSDWDDDAATPATPLPRCVDLSNSDLVDSDQNGTLDTPEHEYWGCAPWTDPE